MAKEDPWAKLRRMKSSGEITSDEYERARELMVEEFEQMETRVAEFSRKWGARTCVFVVFCVCVYVFSELFLTAAREPEAGLGPGIQVTRSEYGDRWPYIRFDAATIRCTPHETTGRPLVTIQYDGANVVYGLNGAALGVGGFPDPSHFIARGSDGIPKAPLPQEWIDRGLQLCGE